MALGFFLSCSVHSAVGSRLSFRGGRDQELEVHLHIQGTCVGPKEQSMAEVLR